MKVFRGSGIHLLVEGVGDDLATVWLQSTPGTVCGDVTKEVGGAVGRGDRGKAGNVHNERYEDVEALEDKGGGI